jgi:hypothetical protein
MTGVRAPNITGAVFGRLTVLHRHGRNRNAATWLCVCKCGTETIAEARMLRRGTTQSCGCLRRESVIAVSKTHGMSKTRTFAIWRGMIHRCGNKNATEYMRYGGRGITVCKQWLEFSSFLVDMGEAPAGLTIDRIDNDDGYRPENCRWATRREKQNNLSSNRRITFNGLTLTVTQWADKVGMSRSFLWQRLFRDEWPIKRALQR